MFITSKLQPGDAQGTEAVLKAFERTIERLGVKQLDLYLIHWPGMWRKPPGLRFSAVFWFAFVFFLGVSVRCIDSLGSLRRWSKLGMLLLELKE